MTLKFRHFIWAKLILVCFLLPSVTAQEISTPHVSGFGRVIAGIAQYDDINTLNYTKNLSLKPNSLIAIQADWSLSQDWSATSQIVGYLDDEKSSGIEWLYLTYQPSDSMKVKIGRLRTPFFDYSDVLDVGYAYHWITPPSEVYASYLFSNYDGVSLIHNYSNNQLSLSIEPYIGRFSGIVTQDGRQSDIILDFIAGISLKANVDKLSLRASFNRGNIGGTTPLFFPVPFTQLQQLFSANGLGHLIDQIEVKGRFDFNQIGFSYDSFNYFIKGEVTQFKHQFKVMPQITSFYLSAGYQFDDYLIHLTLANREDKLKAMLNPIGSSPALAQLKATYQQLISARVVGDQKSVTLGIRWDLLKNVALKTDIRHIRYGNNVPHQHDGSSLLQLGLEWLF